jgi:hypothetical protein
MRKNGGIAQESRCSTMSYLSKFSPKAVRKRTSFFRFDWQREAPSIVVDIMFIIIWSMELALMSTVHVNRVGVDHQFPVLQRCPPLGLTYRLLEIVP